MTSDSPLRILYLTTSMGLGGADKQALVLADNLREHGHEIKIISITPLGKMGENARQRGIPTESLQVKSKSRFPFAISKLIREVRSFDPDILHSHMFHSNLLARCLSPLFSDLQVISTVHNTYENATKSGAPKERTWRERAYKHTDFLSDMTTFVSEHARERYLQIDAVSKYSSRVIYNGIDTGEFYYDEDARNRIRDTHDLDDEFVWITVGAFISQKDYPTLIKSYERLNKADSSRLFIIGHGPLEQQIKSLAQEQSSSSKSVEFLGKVPSVQEYMSAADGFVLASQWEGYGLVVAEAMACELPVISTKCGGPEELISHGETGFLTQKGDETKLADTMEHVMNLPTQKRKNIGLSAREAVQSKFSIQSAVSEWENIYYNI